MHFEKCEVTTALKNKAVLAAKDTNPITFIGIERQKPVSIDSLRAEVQIHQPDVLFVDSAYLMQFTGDKTLGHYQRQGAMANELNFLAVELGIPIVASYQLNRESVKKQEKGGKVFGIDTTSVAGSDEIVRIASIVIAIVAKDEDSDGNQLPSRTLKVLKNRKGLDNLVFQVNWNTDKFDFSELDVDKDFEGNLDEVKENAHTQQ